MKREECSALGKDGEKEYETSERRRRRGETDSKIEVERER